MASAEQDRCTCTAHVTLRERGGPVTADDVRELAEAHLRADRRRWFTCCVVFALFVAIVLVAGLSIPHQ